MRIKKEMKTALFFVLALASLIFLHLFEARPVSAEVAVSGVVDNGSSVTVYFSESVSGVESWEYDSDYEGKVGEVIAYSRRWNTIFSVAGVPGESFVGKDLILYRSTDEREEDTVLYGKMKNSGCVTMMWHGTSLLFLIGLVISSLCLLIFLFIRKRVLLHAAVFLSSCALAVFCSGALGGLVVSADAGTIFAVSFLFALLVTAGLRSIRNREE